MANLLTENEVINRTDMHADATKLVQVHIESSIDNNLVINTVQKESSTLQSLNDTTLEVDQLKQPDDVIQIIRTVKTYRRT